MNWEGSNGLCQCGSGSISKPKSEANNKAVCEKAGTASAAIGIRRQNFQSYCAAKCGHNQDAGVKCDARTIKTDFGEGNVRLTDVTTGDVT